jgi:hypothetical protein
MKKGILLLLLFGSVFAHAQSLKDALFSGKLKNDPGSVIRKGDDLSTKIDTSRKVATVDSTRKVVMVDSFKLKMIAPIADSAKKVAVIQADTVLASKPDNNITTTTNSSNNSQVPVVVPVAAAGAATVADAAKENPPVAKDNNALWKGYMDSLVTTLKTEVLPNKKVKKETYSVMVTYSIGVDGQVTPGDVFVSPDNSFLQQQIKDRLNIGTPPHLNPVLNSAGAPRKVTKRYSFTLVKEK